MNQRIEGFAGRSPMAPWLLAAASVALMAATQNALGRIWWCKFGDRAIYVNEAWNSSHTSQHLFDPYTFTHILHGIILFWLVTLLFKNLSGSWQFLIAIAAEAAWEVFENTNYIIDKYRENTASLDYFGDSIANSIGDVLACAVGFWIAFKLGLWRSIFFFIAVEAMLILWIRDSLLLNILMLIYPSEAIKQWQMGIGG
jgi:hypothetical protein